MNKFAILFLFVLTLCSCSQAVEEEEEMSGNIEEFNFGPNPGD